MVIFTKEIFNWKLHFLCNYLANFKKQFFTFFKLYKWYQIAQRITFECRASAIVKIEPNERFCKFIKISSWTMCRSSRLEVFFKKGVLKNFAKFTGKHLCQSLFFNIGIYYLNLFIKKDKKTQLFYRTSAVAASVCEMFAKKRW